MSATTFTVGPATYTKEGVIHIHRYPNGEPCLRVVGLDDEPQCSATLVPPGAPRIGPERVWLKGYSENEGVPEAMQAAGLVTLTGKRFPCGYADALEPKLSPALLSAVKAVLSPRHKEPQP